MFGMTVRALRDLSLFDAGGQAAPGPARKPEFDVDALRASISRKLEALIAEQETGQPAEEIYRGMIGTS